MPVVLDRREDAWAGEGRNGKAIESDPAAGKHQSSDEMSERASKRAWSRVWPRPGRGPGQVGGS